MQREAGPGDVGGRDCGRRRLVRQIGKSSAAAPADFWSGAENGKGKKVIAKTPARLRKRPLRGGFWCNFPFGGGERKSLRVFWMRLRAARHARGGGVAQRRIRTAAKEELAKNGKKV